MARRIGDLPNIAELEMLRRIGDATDAAKIVTLLFLRVGESWTVVQVRYRADPVLERKCSTHRRLVSFPDSILHVKQGNGGMKCRTREQKGCPLLSRTNVFRSDAKVGNEWGRRD